MDKQSPFLVPAGNVLIPYLPNGTPAPAVLTAQETAEFLRLDGKNPERTLKYWRDEGQLCGVRIGKKLRYPLSSVMKFLAQKEMGGCIAQWRPDAK